jgi:hypothetical protein
MPPILALGLARRRNGEHATGLTLDCFAINADEFDVIAISFANERYSAIGA